MLKAAGREKCRSKRLSFGPLNRGSLRLAVGDSVQAAQDFSMVLRLEPRSAAEAYRLRSVAYAGIGWPMEAARDRSMAESPRGGRPTWPATR